jgi:hypothetical protein
MSPPLVFDSANDASVPPLPAAPEYRLNSSRAPDVGDNARIRAVLEAFRVANERLDLGAIAALWPNADTRALTQVFSTIARQRISFDRCDIQLAGALATARCNGTIEYALRESDVPPQSRGMSWSFVLDKASGEWRVANVMSR